MIANILELVDVTTQQVLSHEKGEREDGLRRPTW